jgi:2-iminobutanoate/2-iminopropanoate deaminase
MKIITTEKAPAAIGPYSQAVQADNGMVWLSGQIGLDATTGELKEGLEEQTKQIFINIEGVLEAAGLTKTNIVKTTVFVTNIGDFLKVNDLYSQFFGDHKPARSTVEVSSLPKGAVIEIEVLAVK